MLQAANSDEINANHHQSSLQPWVVCLVAALFFFYEFVQMNMFNAVNHDLMRAFSVDATKLGYLSSAYFIANILFMFPAGILLDRFSTRKLILTAMAICVAGTLAFSMAHTLWAAIVCRFLTGIGGSFPFLCCLRLASRWFPPRRMALITGVIVTIAMLGGMAAQTPLTFLVTITSWRDALRFDALLGVLFFALIWWQVKDYPANAIIPKINHTDVKLSSIRQIIKQTLTNKHNWLFGGYISMMNLPLMLLGGLWGSLYLTQARHLTALQSSYVTSMIFLGLIIGSPIVGWFSDRIGNRKKPMFAGAAITVVAALTLMYLPSLSLYAAMALFFILGFATSTQIIGYPAITESNSIKNAGSALGFASVIIMVGPALFEPLFGHILDSSWHGLMTHGSPLYSPTAFIAALAIFPITCGLAYLAIIFCKETLGASALENLEQNIDTPHKVVGAAKQIV